MRPDPWIQQHNVRRRAKHALVASIAVTLALYFVPGVGWLGRPLVLLSTLVHELGHGLAAIAMGGSFTSLQVFSDASGLAEHTSVGGGVPSAVVAAGGLVGPALAAGVAFVFGRSARLARVGMGLAALAFAATIVVVSNAFGMFLCGVLALLMAAMTLRKDPALAQFGLVFLGTQLSLTVFSRSDYLFVETAKTGGGTFPSDVANIAMALGGSYWMWGLVCGAFSVVVLMLGAWWFLRGFK